MLDLCGHVIVPAMNLFDRQLQGSDSSKLTTDLCLGFDGLSGPEPVTECIDTRAATMSGLGRNDGSAC